MNKTVFGAATLAALVFGGASIAQDASDKFVNMDGNGDGTVSSSEYTTYATASGISPEEAELQFAVLAGDDGVLERAEYDAVMEVEDAAKDWDASTTIESDMDQATEDMTVEADPETGSEG